MMRREAARRSPPLAWAWRLAALSLLLALIAGADFGCRGSEVAPAAPASGPAAAPGAPLPEPLARLASSLPLKPLVLIYSPQLSGLIEEIKSSRLVQGWLASASFKRFKQSGLWVRLINRMAEIFSLMGEGTGLSDLAPFAGGESVLALYDRDGLKFFYVSELSFEELAKSPLWTALIAAPAGEVMGEPFFTLTPEGKDGGLWVAEANGYLLVADDRVLFGDVLVRLLGKEVEVESLEMLTRFHQAFPSRLKARDLLVYLDQEALSIDRELAGAWVAEAETVVVDLELEPGRWDERRFFSGRSDTVGRDQTLPECALIEAEDVFGACRVIAGEREAAREILKLIAAPAAGETAGLAASPARLEALEKALAKARPAALVEKSRLNWTGDRMFWTVAKVVAIRLEAPKELSAQELRMAIAAAWEDMILPGTDGEVDWRRDGDGHVASPRLFPQAALWVDQAGPYLVASTDGELHRRALEALKDLAPPAAGAGFSGLTRSRWRLDPTRTEARRLIDALGRGDGWPSPLGRRVAPLDAMGRLVSLRAGEVVWETRSRGGLLEERVVARELGGDK